MLTPSSRGVRLAVVGTLNVDRIWCVPALPAPGETILAGAVRTQFGGKGANQAIAAARQGAIVTMIGAVGCDEDGRGYRDHLVRERIDVSQLLTVANLTTGTAHVYVDAAGENSIVVSRGANAALDAGLVRQALAASPHPAAVVVQLECPLEAALEALRIAAARGIRSILNASPVTPDFPWAAVPIDVLIVNEHECVAALGCTVAALRALPAGGRRELLASRRVGHVVVTQGSEPTLHVAAEALHEVPTLAVRPVDTVGAGDTFAGILATRLAEDAAWPEALSAANAGAALATLALGAQAAMPSRADTEAARSSAPAVALRAPAD